ncbi:MAG: hypothetical protein CBARDCOR_5392 [uncultured Caballeronia sp.]|nr:MAG: hypothetical protein CBARDCOR_5392 [uncultured Caballeronia sp.]
MRTGKLQDDAARHLAEPMRRRLATELAIRPMLDAMYPPRAELFRRRTIRWCAVARN